VGGFQRAMGFLLHRSARVSRAGKEIGTGFAPRGVLREIVQAMGLFGSRRSATPLHSTGDLQNPIDN